MLHHCGSHKHFRLEYFKHKAIDFSERTMRGLLHDKNEFIFYAKESINEKRAKVSIFKGMEIRLFIANLDKVSKILICSFSEN